MIRTKIRSVACLVARCCLLGLLICGATPGGAATYYVATTGDNANNGSQSSPWRTIAYASGRVVAGDTVRVLAGIYNEQARIAVDGNSANYVSFMSDDANSKAVCRGFYLDGVDYVRIIGFEITHNSTSFNGAIQLNGTCSHVEILDNYIHHVRGRASGEGAVISATGTANTSYITIRGNTLFHLGFLSGVFSHANIAGIYSDYGTSDHWLIEYNSIQRSADFMYSMGEHHIVRNNALGDVDASYWPNGGGMPHTDIFQIGSDGVVANNRYGVYEANFCTDNSEPDGHFFLQQNTASGGDTTLLVRGNVVANFGSGAVGNIATPNLLTHNNTYYDIVNVADGGAVYIQYGSPAPSGCMFVNSIIQNAGTSRDAIDISSGSATAMANIGYQAGSEASYTSTADPRFVNPASGVRNFRLQSGSPAINAGAILVTISSASGSGTSFNVNNGALLCDGKGICDGDVITTGGTTTRVTSISGNTVTVANAVTWTSGQPVYWGTDTTPDIGALPYGSTELTAAALSQAGTTYTVTTMGDARGVWFYVNGIPVLWDSAPPYSGTFASGTVTAKAYALYAQAMPVVTATTSGTPPPPDAPTGLRITP